MKLLWVIPVLPLIGAAFNGVVGKRLPRKLVGLIGTGTVLGSFLIAATTFWQMLQLQSPGDLPLVTNYFTWIQSGTFEANFGLMLDHLSGLMIVIVTGVGFLIHVY